jgi:hypothetical protein
MPAEEESGAEAAPTRAWFPETFLFNPLVVTDDSGNAKLSVHVPDRLTSWRVLALAHSRAGAQAGAETRFEGTLPIYVDPVIPSFLMAGDEVSLPVQVVNTTDQPVTSRINLALEGAALARALASVKIEAQGSAVTYAPVRANHPGVVVLHASLGGTDAVDRTFPVRPVGRPVVESRSGTLAATRSLRVALPADADRESATARLQVYPGALAILRAELGAAASRGSVDGDAYALLLAGRGESLLRKLGGDADPKALRELALTATQRAIRAARTPDVVTAALFAEAALSHPESPVLARLGERLVATVATGQRPDGTFAGADGWTLQRLLVTTAECVRAVRAASDTLAARQRTIRATLASRRAFERNIDRIEDGYTAAAVLASGTLEGAVKDRLRKRVRDGLRHDPDGTSHLAIDKGVVRIDGTPPSEAEGTALAILALRDDPGSRDIVPDLGSRLLAGYDPAHGFGDGRTNLVALTAVLSLFAEKLPDRVVVTLAQDGRVLAERALEGAKLREVLVLEAPLPEPGRQHAYELRAEPSVPGLGYSFALKGYVPWPAQRTTHDLELSVDVPKEIHVGHAVDVAITAAAPAGMELTIRHALPAGVQVDTESLDALVSDETIRSYDREDGAVTLKIAARTAGQVFTARYRAVPTLAGRLHAGASTIAVSSLEEHLAPSLWVVK